MNSILQTGKSIGRALLVGCVAMMCSIAAYAEEGHKSLHQAIAAGDTALVIGLLSAGIDPDTPVEGTTAVQRATRLGRNQILQLLVSHKARLTGDDVVYAAELGNVFAVVLFIEQGLDVNSADPYEMTALQHAALNGHAATVNALLERGADVDAREVVQGYNALILASAHGYADVVALLLAKGADRNAVTEDGYTALSWAMERAKPGSGHGRVIHLLRAGE